MSLPEDIWEMRLLFKSTASPRVMSTALGLGFVGVSPPTPAQAALDLNSLNQDTGMPCDNAEYIDDYIFLGTEVALGTSTGDIVAQDLVSVTGSLSDNVVPSNTAMVVTKNTALGGRRYRGRMFWPPIILNEGAVDPAGNIASSPLASIQGNFDAWYAALVAADWTPLLLHQGASAPIPTAITSFTVQSLCGTQRRRMRS